MPPGGLDDPGFDAADYARAYAETAADADRPVVATRWPSPAERAAWIATEAAFRYRLVHPVTVDREADIPAFATDGDEADYWATHRLSPRLRRVFTERGTPWPDADAEASWEPVPLGGDARLPVPADLTRRFPERFVAVVDTGVDAPGAHGAKGSD